MGYKSFIRNIYTDAFLKNILTHLTYVIYQNSKAYIGMPYPSHYCEELKKLPLNSDSAKGNLLSIKGSKDWWARLEWENEVTREAFLPSFKLLY
ncbi:hypothetical protein J1N35_033219 [Gossypium stocksii]|uniref:Uncharacterized protein n=1 Tax=Gossypium stocksii TaxID=47602 RepID=A0A9D3UQI7_9ROSI|nr:hypothetical protein J1N35_033219 [Gossypium stocksii]